MKTGTAFLTVAIIWVITGLILAYGMRRRGHAPFTWWLLGTLFGPFAMLLALDAARHERDPKPDQLTARLDAVGAIGGAPPLGAASTAAGSEARIERRERVDILVGVDGSPEALAAIDTVKSLFADRIGRLTIATVAPFEATQIAGLKQDAERILTRAKPAVKGIAHDTIILHGRATEALAEHATAGHYGLVAVGAGGRGLNSALLGSVASTLSRGTNVPVLIVGRPPQA